MLKRMQSQNTFQNVKLTRGTVIPANSQLVCLHPIRIFKPIISNFFQLSSMSEKELGVVHDEHFNIFFER